MSQAEPNGKKTILVIDDEPHIVTYLEALLEDHGYATVAAANGREGMEMTRAHHPDLICLDITMPKQSGIRYYRDLKDDPELAGIPVVVVTAVTGYGGDPQSFKQFLDTRKQVPPPEGFFSKPIDRDTFLEKVAEIVGQ
jgi:CheY-like chemotaxis protein